MGARRMLSENAVNINRQVQLFGNAVTRHESSVEMPWLPSKGHFILTFFWIFPAILRRFQEFNNPVYTLWECNFVFYYGTEDYVLGGEKFHWGMLFLWDIKLLGKGFGPIKSL